MNVETGGGKSAEKFEQERQGKKSVQEPVWEPESGSWQAGNTELLKFPGFQKLLGPGSQMLPPCAWDAHTVSKVAGFESHA